MIGAYFTRHLQVFVSSLGKLAYSPLASFMTILVIAITLALPAALHVMVKNALEVTGGWQDAVDFSAYLQPDVSLDTATNLAKLLRSRADIEDVTVIDSDTALAGFAEQSGFGDALDSLETNPLPHTLVVRPLASLSPEASDLLRQELDGLPETDVVQLDTEWIARFQAILNLVRRAIWIAGGALGLGLLVVIGNTIRLDIQNRRDEIEIMQLIGASDPFIRRPFLYTGLWYGLGGGLMALGLLAVMLSLLGGPVSQLAGLYGSGWSLLGPTLKEIGIIVGVGVALGLSGSWFATARHMRRIDPK
ncbi:MAG: permease-like cell division protein FtsX [Pseudomonadota bacterium]